MDKKQIQALGTARHTMLQIHSQNSLQELKSFQQWVNKWIIRMETVLKAPVNFLTLEHLQRVSDLLYHGIQLASNIRTHVSTILNLHSKLCVPLNKTNLVSLCKMAELLKAIENISNRSGH